MQSRGSRVPNDERRTTNDEQRADMHTLEGSDHAKGFRFAIVVARFNDFITDRLLAGALEALSAAGIESDDVTVLRVPGSYEIPIAAQRVAESSRVDAAIGRCSPSATTRSSSANTVSSLATFRSSIVNAAR